MDQLICQSISAAKWWQPVPAALKLATFRVINRTQFHNQVLWSKEKTSNLSSFVMFKKQVGFKNIPGKACVKSS